MCFIKHLGTTTEVVNIFSSSEFSKTGQSAHVIYWFSYIKIKVHNDINVNEI